MKTLNYVYRKLLRRLTAFAEGFEHFRYLNSKNRLNASLNDA